MTNLKNLFRLSLIAAVTFFIAANANADYVSVNHTENILSGTEIMSINNSGMMAGTCWGENPPRHGFIYDGSSFEMIYVDGMGSIPVDIKDINDSGNTVGYYVETESSISSFLLIGTEYTAISVPEGTDTAALGLNNSDHIVGAYRNSQETTSGFLFNGTDYTTINYPGKTGTFLSDINNNGDIVGYYLEDARFSSFIYDGEFKDVNYPEATSTQIHGINDNGLVVGTYSMDNVNYGFLYDGTTFTSMMYPDASETRAHGINNSNRIVGWYADDEPGFRRGFDIDDFIAIYVQEYEEGQGNEGGGDGGGGFCFIQTLLAK